MADGTIKADLVEVVEAAGVIQKKQATVLEGFRQDAIGKALLGQVLENRTFINIIVSKQVELLVLEPDFFVHFQCVVVAVGAEHDLSVIDGEDGIQVGVVVVGDLLQSIGKQIVDINVGLAHAGGSQHNLSTLMGIRERTDLLEIEEIGVGFLSAVDIQIVELDFAFFLKDERQDLAIGMPSQKRERSVDILVGVVACLEELLPFAALQVLEPKAYLALIVTDIGDVFAVRANRRLRESAVLLVFQLHQVGGLVG